MKRVKIAISGNVRGVYFRAFIKDRANELGLTGYTKNLEDKKVEVIVEGHELKINKLIEACEQGPIGSKVEKVSTTNLPYIGEFKEFKIKY